MKNKVYVSFAIPVQIISPEHLSWYYAATPNKQSKLSYCEGSSLVFT